MKAILMLDEMPNECDGCPCLNHKLWHCQADKKHRDGGDDNRPEWCRLIEINDNIAKLIEVAR